MVLLKRTLIALGLVALLLVPGVVTVSHVASADEATGTMPTVTAKTTPAETPGVDSVNDSSGNNNGDAPEGSEGSDNPTTDPTAPNEGTDITWTDCSSYVNADGDLVQRCVGVDSDGNPVAKSSVDRAFDNVPTQNETNTAAAATSTSANARATVPARSTTPAFPVSTSAARSVRGNAPTPAPAPVANDTADEGTDAVENQETEAPKLPVTGTKKNVKDGGEEVASAALIIDDELTLASSRAGILSLIACAGFAVVAAGSVVTMRNFKH